MRGQARIGGGGALAAFGVLSAVLAVGQGRAEPGVAVPPEPKPGEAAGVRPGDVAPSRNIHAVDGPGLKKAIAAHRGKVVVLNLWATWCGPCVEEFPALVEFHEKYQKRGVAIVSACMDDPEDRGKVAAFLALQRAKFPVYIRRAGSIDAFFDPVDKKWSGALPMTYLLDRAGKPVGKPIAKEQTFEQLAKLVEPLLK